MAISNLPKLNFSVPFAMTAALPVEYNAYFDNYKQCFHLYTFLNFDVISSFTFPFSITYIRWFVAGLSSPPNRSS